jgi:hypothetical protein
MRREGLGNLKISKNPTGTRTRNHPSCGAVPQPIATALATDSKKVATKNKNNDAQPKKGRLL